MRRRHITILHGVNARLAYCLNSVLNVKAVVAAFNQAKALVGAFSVIVQLHRLIVCSTSYYRSYFVAGDSGIRPGEQQDGESAHG